MRNGRSVPREAKPVALTMGVRKACIAVVKKTINQCVVCLFLAVRFLYFLGTQGWAVT
jgi:hypothetical protein